MRRFLGYHIATPWLVFGFVEAFLIAGGCCAAFYYLFPSPDLPPGGLTAFAVMLALGVLALMHSGGLYAGDALLNLKRATPRVAVITIPIFALAVWTTGELAKHTDVPIYPYRWQWTGALTGAWLFLALGLRILFRQLCRAGVLTRRVIAVCSGTHATEVYTLARESSGRFEVAAILDPFAKQTYRNGGEELLRMVLQSRASEVVVSAGSDVQRWNSLLQRHRSGIRMTTYREFYERETRRVRIDDPHQDWMTRPRGNEPSRRGERFRRVTDILLSAAVFLATAPVLVFSAFAIKLEDGGPILYRQERIGLNGRPFVLFKFRSMREDAEHDGTPTWASERDHRVTNVGRAIRKLRIDELPQLWNVIKGDMSLIGPRPERPFFVRQFTQSIPFYGFRHSVRPGITGWAQVSFRYGASLEDTRRKLSYDLYYIKNRSFFLDMIILLRTMGVVLSGEGAR